ncbi:MAG: prepilin-type N-terminal cleavage/methylation domain-containing protein [Terriglobia bacterium]
MKKNSKGFSLIELLIVVAIILIIAAIAIPNLLRSRMAANQASAVGSLRTIGTAEVTYASTYNTGYSATLADIGPPAAAGAASATAADMIDAVLSGTNPASATPTKSGYTFTYTAGAADTSGNVDTFGTTSVPATVGSTGQDAYGIDQTNVIYYTTTGTAPSITDGTTRDSTDKPLQ